jgi:hypothetical protein
MQSARLKGDEHPSLDNNEHHPRHRQQTLAMPA